MRKIKSYKSFDSLVNEKYKFTEIMEFSDEQLKKLDEIEKVYSQIPIDDLEQCAMGLEDIGYNYYRGCVLAILWRGDKLNSSRLHTSDDISFNCLYTSDFHKKTSNIFDSENFKVLNIELIQSLWLTKTQQEITQVFDNEMIKSHFHNSILREIEQFDDYIQEGFIPCVSISKLNCLKNWTLNPQKVDAIYEFKQRVNSLYNYEIVFAPNIDEPSIILVDKKYIKF